MIIENLHATDFEGTRTVKAIVDYNPRTVSYPTSEAKGGEEERTKIVDLLIAQINEELNSKPQPVDLGVISFEVKLSEIEGKFNPAALAKAQDLEAAVAATAASVITEPDKE